MMVGIYLSAGSPPRYVTSIFHGRRRFEVLPRVGEFVLIVVANDKVLLEVEAVIHDVASTDLNAMAANLICRRTTSKWAPSA